MLLAQFDQDTEGWTVSGGGLAHDPDTGSLRGWDGDSDYWQFVAPAEWLVDRSASYGATLSFDLRQKILTSQLDNSQPDVTLEGAGLRLVADLGGNPGMDWTSYGVQLAFGGGWKIGSLTGRVATETEIRAALADLTRLSIRGEFVNGLTDDTSWLDNVVLSDPGTVPVIPGGPQILETFDSDLAGWSFIADVAEFRWQPTGGNGGGYVEAVDYSTGEVWYFVAPARFLGERGAFFGGELSFDLKQSGTYSQFNDDDIVLEGGGLRLVFDTPDNPGTDWTSYSIALSAAASWKVGSGSGALATDDQIRAALADLQALHIRGEFITGADTGGLDNVALTAAAAPVYLLSDAVQQDLLGSYARLDQALAAAEPGQAILVVDNTSIGVAPWQVQTEGLTVISDLPLAGGFVLDATVREFALAGANRAQLIAGDNDNVLTGSAGANRIEAGEGHDSVAGGAGNDTLLGEGGNDTLYGGDDHDLLIGGAGNDLMRGGPGNDTFWGGAGNDDILLTDGDNEVWAGDGLDTVIGGTGNDTLGGGAGDDLVDARAGGRNALWGSDGNDTLFASGNGDAAGGGADNDLVHGGAGHDTLMGGLGNDTVNGYGGNDRLYLGTGSDLAYAGAGNDTIFGGPGFDRMWGGDGADRFEFWRSYDWNRVEDFSAAHGDTLALGRGMWTGTHGALTAQQVVDTFGSVNGAGDAVLNFGTAGTTVVLVGAGTLDGLAGSIVIL